MLDGLKIALARRMYPVRVAGTDAEREAIYRFRYDLRVGEFNWQSFPGIDHDRKLLRGPEDDAPNTTNYYVGARDDVLGTMRVRLFAPGTLPAEVKDVYSLDRFPDIDGRTVAEFGYFFFRRSLRGTAAATSLAVEAAARGAEQGGQALFAMCPVGLIGAYQRLGLRTFGGRVRSSGYGVSMHIPMVAILDLDYLYRIGAPGYPILRKLQQQGKLPPCDVSGMVRVVEESPSASSSPEEVEDELRRAFDELPAGSFLSQIPERLLHSLAESGHVVAVREGDQVIASDVRDQEMYVVLDGVFEARRGGRSLRAMEKGETFGEVAFFRESGRRSAEVHALTPGKLLVLRRNFLRRMIEESPRDACAIYEAACRVMAERIART